jgi:hypothetical protein
MNMKNVTKTKRPRTARVAAPIDRLAAFELARELLRLTGTIGQARASLPPNERLSSAIALLAIGKIIHNISLEATDGLTQSKIALVSYAIAKDISHAERLNLDTDTDDFLVAAGDGHRRHWNERWFSKRGMSQMDRRANTLVGALRRRLLQRTVRPISHTDEFTAVAAAARVCHIGLHPLLLAAADIRSNAYVVSTPPDGEVGNAPGTKRRMNRRPSSSSASSAG